MLRQVSNFFYRAAKAIDIWGSTGNEWYWSSSHHLVADTPTASGIVVNQSTALNYSVVFRCIRVISESLSSLPLILYKRIGEGKERADDHPVYILLHDTPNPEMTSVQFRDASVTNLLLWGNSYSEISRNLMGRPIALWPLDSSRMNVDRVNNQLVYEYNMSDGTKKFFSSWNILHIPGLSFNGITGNSVIGYARDCIALGMAQEKFGSKFFANSATPRGVLEHPQTLGLDAMKRKVDDFNKIYGGVDNSNKTLILPDGMTYKPLSMSNADSQFLETRKFQVVDLCRFFGVPPHLVMALEDNHYNNIEHAGLDYVTYGLRPWAIRIEQAVSKKLLSEAEQKTYFCEHLFDALLRGDIQSRYAAYQTALRNGLMNRDEIRAKENMNPVEDGDVYYISSDLQRTDAVPETIPGGNGKDITVTPKDMTKMMQENQDGATT